MNVRSLAAFFAGALCAGAFFDLATQYGLLVVDVRLALIVVLVGGIAGVLAMRAIRKRRRPNREGSQAAP
jgi:hypothetical protein